MRRIGKITGRSDDMMIIRGVNVFPTQIEELISKLPNLSAHYLLEVNKEGHLDTLKVNVELNTQATGISAGALSDLTKELKHMIKTHVGVSTEVVIKKPFELERSVGKAKRVIDLRPKK